MATSKTFVAALRKLADPARVEDVGRFFNADPNAQWIREAGKKDQPRLVRFLRAHAGSMPRSTVRMAIEKLPPKERAVFLQS